MSNYRARAPLGFGSGFTPLGKKMLILYGVIFIFELISEHWLKVRIVSYLPIYPLNSSHFHFWQFLSHPFVHDPYSPFAFAINCLVFYFFCRPVENALGTKRFLILYVLSAFIGMCIGLLLGGVSGFNVPFMGMLPSLLSLIVVFGLLNPEATILLMFILPIKAKYISYGTMLITLLTFLAKANPHGAYHLGGILMGYVYLKSPGWLFDPAFIHLKYLEWRLKRNRARFQIIDGDKHKDDDTPTYH